MRGNFSFRFQISFFFSSEVWPLRTLPPTPSLRPEITELIWMKSSLGLRKKNLISCIQLEESLTTWRYLSLTVNKPVLLPQFLILWQSRDSGTLYSWSVYSIELHLSDNLVNVWKSGFTEIFTCQSWGKMSSSEGKHNQIKIF